MLTIRLFCIRGLKSTTAVRLHHVMSRNSRYTLVNHSARTGIPIRVVARQYSSGDQPVSPTSATDDPELFRPTPTYDLNSSTSDLSSGAASDVAQSAENIVSQSEGLAAVGLGGYTPAGLIQSALDLIHTHTHLPWWATVAAATVAIRFMLIPLAVQLHVNAIKIANINPMAMEINKKMMEYKMAGNTIGMAMEGKKLTELYAKHECNPFKSFLMPLVQLPIFVSFFFALRQMASLPLESMKTGGMYWFTDLTVPDPFYALPLMACASFITNIELGAEGGSPTDNEFSKKVKMFMRASAVLILPISMKFPAAMFMYWVTNSMFSTAQILLFRNPSVKKVLGIPTLNKRTPTS